MTSNPCAPVWDSAPHTGAVPGPRRRRAPAQPQGAASAVGVPTLGAWREAALLPGCASCPGSFQVRVMWAVVWLACMVRAPEKATRQQDLMAPSGNTVG